MARQSPEMTEGTERMMTMFRERQSTMLRNHTYAHTHTCIDIHILLVHMHTYISIHIHFYTHPDIHTTCIRA